MASVNHYSGDPFTIYSPLIPGYQTNMLTISGKMGNRDDVYHVIYTPIEYTLTIEFLDRDGEEVAAPVTLKKMRLGDEYEVPTPSIDGLRAGTDVVRGVFSGSQTVRVVYLPADDGYTVIEEYSIPRGFGSVPVNIGECWE